MSSIYLISPSGHPNYGDELIAAGWLRHLAATRPETEVWLDCPNPGLATELFHGLHPRLHTTNTLWRACWEASSTDPDIVMAEVVQLVKNFGSPAYDLGLERLRSMDSIHMLGGGYLNSLWPINAGLVAGAVAVRSLTGAKLYATGLSVVPMFAGAAGNEGDAESRTIELLRRFDHITVRDGPSADALDLPLGLDDAFLAVEHERHRGLARGGADVVVCLQSDLQSPTQSERVAATVRELVREALAEGKTVQYVEAIPGVDRAGFDALADLISSDDFIPFVSVWRDGLPLKSGQTWLTTRFHLHFLAAAAGASGTAISIKEGYYDIKHRSLIDLGTGWSYSEASRAEEYSAQDPHAANSSFSSELGSRVDQKRKEAQGLYSRVSEHLAQGRPTPHGGTRTTRRLIQGLRAAMNKQK